jgi:hypothetical protein
MRGSGFQNGANVTLGQKNGCGHVVDMNTLKVVAPALPCGARRIVITNPDGEAVPVDTAFIAN